MSDKPTVDEADHAPPAAAAANTLTSTTVADEAPNRNANLSTSDKSPAAKEWVKFDDEGPNKDSQPSAVAVAPPPANPTVQESTKRPPAAVLEAETTHVSLQVGDGGSRKSPPRNGVEKKGTFPVTTAAAAQPGSISAPAVIDIPPVATVRTNGHSNGTATEMSQMRTIELSTGTVREGFANGDVIVTLLPLNRNLPWITPPVFRPELVPEELMAQGLTLTVEEYVQAMETLVNDYRFTMYNMCYKRVLVCWIMFAFGILLALLFSGLTGITLFALGVTWLFMNMATVFFCMWIKIRLARGLEKCLARVNKQLLRHKILLVLDDRGRISCHKVNLCFVYFDPAQCVNYLNGFIEHNEQNGTAIEPGWEARLDLNTSDIVIQGANTTRVSRKQTRAENLYLRYGQRWGKDFLRRRLDWILAENCQRNGTARHLQAAICPCQYVEEILNCKDLRPSFPSRLRSCFLNCC